MPLEILGAATGTLGVLSLFTECVEATRYVQLGRHFSADYGIRRLELDLLELRLSRWGEAVNIYDDTLLTDPGNTQGQVLMQTLSQIHTTLERARSTSERYNVRTSSTPDICEVSDMDQLFQIQHSRLQRIITERQKRTSIRQKTIWAIYHRSTLDEMLASLKSLITTLEELFPSEMSSRTGALVLAELGDVEDGAILQRLHESSSGNVDPALHEAVQQKLDDFHDSFTIRRVELGDNSRTKTGHIVGSEFAGQDLPRNGKSTHLIEDLKSGKRSRVHAGNTYGSNNFWDN